MFDTPNQITANGIHARGEIGRRSFDEMVRGIVAYARETPIDMGDGIVYGPKPVTKDELDGKVAERALAAEFSPEFARVATEVDCTKAGISRAVRRHLSEHPEESKRGALGAMEKRALAAIEKAGGVRKVTSYQVTEHRPKTDAREAA